MLRTQIHGCDIMSDKILEGTEYELLSCYHCGTTQRLGSIHEIEDYAYRQIYCKKCAKEWYKAEMKR